MKIPKYFAGGELTPAFFDRLVYGVSFERINNDGELERIDPATVYREDVLPHLCGPFGRVMPQ